MEEQTTFYEVLRLPWPGGGEWVQELIYRVDAAGQVVTNSILTTEQRAALQALVNHRGPEARQARGNSLQEISADSPEARLSLALSMALLSDETREQYEQAQRQEEARELVRENHKPVSFDARFSTSEIEIQEDGTGLVEVMESGPNWTARYTIYILALAPELSILQAYTSFGEYSFNQHFLKTEWTPDESNQFDDFPGELARLWNGLDWLNQ